MNLYNFHSNPESLHGHDEAYMHVPVVVWDKYKNNPDELKKREDAISKNATYSYLYARDVLKKPFPNGENAISKDTLYSRLYKKEFNL